LPNDLLSSSNGVPLAIAISRLTARLCDDFMLAEEAAHWAVASWAVALGVVVERDLPRYVAAATGQQPTPTPPPQSELTSIQGIGPAYEARLRVVGINTVADLAQANPFTLAEQIGLEGGVTTLVDWIARARALYSAQPSNVPRGVVPQPTLAPPLQGIVVAKSGPANYRTISEAISNSSPGSTIKVRPGTYNEQVVIDRHVEIVGDGPREQIIIRSVGEPCIVMQAEDARVQGIVITCQTLGDLHKAAVKILVGQLVLERCAITSEGRGIDVIGPTTNPNIAECDIYSCRNWAILLNLSSNATIQNCKIHDNSGGISIQKLARASITDCHISNNQHIGVAIYEQGNILMRQCRVYRSGYGVIAQEDVTGVIENCDIAENGTNQSIKNPKLLKLG
jgi:predicted flap endonuclease-1-like 5' DNA nuclease